MGGPVDVAEDAGVITADDTADETALETALDSTLIDEGTDTELATVDTGIVEGTSELRMLKDADAEASCA